jgi:hypothetical protein
MHRAGIARRQHKPQRPQLNHRGPLTGLDLDDLRAAIAADALRYT